MSRSGIMLCYPLEESRLLRWNARTYIAQPKLDGDRCRTLLDSRNTMLSSEENDRNFACPQIAEQIQTIKQELISTGIYELDGELYNHKLSHEQIHSRVSRTVNIHEDYQSIEYWIFDHILTNVVQFQRLSELVRVKHLIEAQPNLRLVQSFTCGSIPDIMQLYHKFLELGFEGVIVRKADEFYYRKRFTGIMKFKPNKHDIYTITGWKEEIAIDGTPKDRLGSIICTSDEGTEFSVSAGLDDCDRQHYWAERDELIGKHVKVYYQATSAYGVPKFATDLEIL